MYSFLKEFFGFLKERRKYWLFPIAIFLIIIGAFVVVSSSGSPLAPFIYAIF